MPDWSLAPGTGLGDADLLAALFTASSEAIALFAADGRLLRANDPALALFGGESALERFVRTQHAAFAQALTLGAPAEASGVLHRGAAGNVELAIEFAPCGSGEVRGVVGTFHDATAARAVERRFVEQFERMRPLFDRAPDPIFTLDEHDRLSSLNLAATSRTGFQIEEIVDRPFTDFVALEDRQRVTLALERARSGSVQVEQGTILAKNDVRLETGLRVIPMVVAGRPAGAYVLAVDRAAERDAIGATAFIDALTGLPNRLLLEDRLRQTVISSRRLQRRFALMVLELDRFDEIAQTRGHDAADEMLQVLAKRVIKTVRESDTVARVGTKRFMIVQPAIVVPSNALELARRVIAEVEAPIHLAAGDAAISASIGLALFPEDADDAEALEGKAEIGLERARAEGGGRASGPLP